MGAVRHRGLDLSHEERDACLHALGALHASGKLSLPELDARIEAALAARTEEELAALVREGSRPEVTARRPGREARRALVARAAGAGVTAVRLVVFLGVTLPVALVRVLAVAAVALGVGVVRLLLAAAWIVRFAYQALARWSRSWSATTARAEAGAVPARLQRRRPLSRELVLVPRPQVPAQRDPAKVHPVLVPSEAGAPSTDLVLARRSTDVVLARRPVIEGEIVARERASLDRALPHEDRRVGGLASQLRPLVHRVTDRARWRRITTNACERAVRTRGWRRTTRLSRTSS